MANDGKITLEDIITREALLFGERYEEQAKKAIAANDMLIKSAKMLNEAMGQYRTAGNNSQLLDIKTKEKNAIDIIVASLREEQIALKGLNDERQRELALQKAIDQVDKARQKGSTNNKKAIDDERVAHQKNMNAIKEEERLEVSIQKAKQETLKTQKEASELAKKIIQEQGENIKLAKEQEALEQRRINTEREEKKVLQELQKLEQQKLITDRAGLSLLKEEEALKRAKLVTIKEEKALIEQEQRIIKNNLEIKNRELTIAQKEEAAKKRNTVLTAEEKVQNEQLNRIKKQQARENLGLVGAYEKLNRQRREAQLRLADLLAAEHKNNAEIRIAQREYDILNKKVSEVDKAVDIFQKNIGNYQSAFDGLGGALTSLIAAFGVAAGISSFTDVLGKAFDIIRNYEAEVVNLAAIAGKTRDEIQPLEATIQAVAAASVNSATDVAKLATELIKLGSTPEEAEKLLKPVNDLSIALRASAEDAATLVKSLLNAYGEGAQEAARYTDVLAEAANRSALDFDGLRDSFSYIAPVARTLNFSLEKTAALIGILADNGIKAESAGRLLSTGLGKIADAGLTLEQALDQINKKQEAGASSLEVLSVANNLFGVEAGKLALILANNRDRIDEMTTAYKNSKGSLEELTNKQLKSLDAQLKILDSSFEDYVLKTNDSIGATKGFTNIAMFLAENLDVIIDTIFQAVVVFVTYKTVVLAANAAQKLMAISSNALALSQAYLSGGIAGVRAEMQALNATTKLNPYALLASILVGLIFVLGNTRKNLVELNKETKANTEEVLKNRDVAEENAKNLEKMADRYEELSKKVNKNAKEQKEMNDLTEALSKIAPDAIEKVSKYGDVIALNTDKLREYVKLQKEQAALQTTLALEKEMKLLKELTDQKKEFNDLDKEGNNVMIEGLGLIRQRDGVLQKSGGVTAELRKLDAEDLALVRLRISENKSFILETEARINSLKRLQTQATATNAAVASTGGAKTDTESVERTIELIDAEIKAEKDKIDQLTYSNRAEGKLIDKRIAKLEKEKEAIYSTRKAEKDSKKEREAYLASMKKLDDDAYNLTVFRLNRLKAQNDDVLNDTNASYQEQVDATIRNENILLGLNEEAAEKKIKDLSRYNDKVRDLTDDEISTLLNGGSIKKKLNKDETLALEQYFAEKQRIYQEGEDKIDGLTVNKFEKDLDNRNRELNNSLNQDIIRENERFANERVAEGKREEAVERHEKKIAEIKRQYAIKALQDQIKATEAILATEQFVGEERKKIEADLSNAKKELSDLVTENAQENSKKQELSEEEKAEKVKDLAINLKDSLVDFANAVFDARIQKIDDEITRLNDYYDRQIELAGDDQRKKDLLEKEAEKKREALEKKKREEQRKQAIFNKAIKIIDIGIATALGIMQAYAQLGPILGNVGAALVGAAGAIQLAAVIATPIPKYKGGRKGGPKEVAWVGDGFVNEIIEDKRGNIRVTPAKPTLTQLDEGDTVHSSKDAYKRHVRNSILNNVAMEADRIKFIHAQMHKDKDNSKLEKSIEEAIDKGFKKARININTRPPKIDIGHSIWAHNNTKWNN